MSIIYKTTNLINGKIYVGQNWTSADDGYLGSGLKFKKIIKEFGKDNFKRETLEYITSRNQNYIGNREEYWIDILDARNHDIGYNIAKGGTPPPCVGSDNFWYGSHRHGDKNPYFGKGYLQLGVNNPNYGNGDKIKGEKNPNYGNKWNNEQKEHLRQFK